MKLRTWHLFLFIALSVLLVFSAIYTVSIGATELPFNEVYEVIADKIFNHGAKIQAGVFETSHYKIIWQIRLPRTLFAMCVGAGLAICGAAMQSLVLNPIADPYVLGVSSGASAGAAIALLAPITFLAITQDRDGHFKFVVAEGVNEEGPIFMFGDTNMRMRFSISAREFCDRWSEAGPTHHMAAAVGRHADTLIKVAKIFNVPIEIITR